MNLNLHKNNNIYIVRCYNKFGQSLIKIGYSENMIKRLTTYYYHNPYIEIIDTCFIENGKDWEENFHLTHISPILNE